MAHSNRLLSALETELNRLVVFSYDRVRRHTGSGKKQMFLRAWLRNDAPIPLADIRGSVLPAAAAGAFKPATFDVCSLAPRRETEIALIPVDGLREVTDRALLDQLAVVRFRSRADLSSFSFASVDRPLPYAERLASWEPRIRGRSDGRSRTEVFRRAPALPISS